MAKHLINLIAIMLAISTTSSARIGCEIEECKRLYGAVIDTEYPQRASSLTGYSKVTFAGSVKGTVMMTVVTFDTDGRCVLLSVNFSPGSDLISDRSVVALRDFLSGGSLPWEKVNLLKTKEKRIRWVVKGKGKYHTIGAIDGTFKSTNKDCSLSISLRDEVFKLLKDVQRNGAWQSSEGS